jgi:hypothetical protein
MRSLTRGPKGLWRSRGSNRRLAMVASPERILGPLLLTFRERASEAARRAYPRTPQSGSSLSSDVASIWRLGAAVGDAAGVIVRSGTGTPVCGCARAGARSDTSLKTALRFAPFVFWGPSSPAAQGARPAPRERLERRAAASDGGCGPYPEWTLSLDGVWSRRTRPNTCPSSNVRKRGPRSPSFAREGSTELDRTWVRSWRPAGSPSPTRFVELNRAHPPSTTAPSSAAGPGCTARGSSQPPRAQARDRIPRGCREGAGRPGQRDLGGPRKQTQRSEVPLPGGCQSERQRERSRRPGCPAPSDRTRPHSNPGELREQAFERRERGARVLEPLGGVHGEGHLHPAVHVRWELRAERVQAWGAGLRCRGGRSRWGGRPRRAAPQPAHGRSWLRSRRRPCWA